MEKITLGGISYESNRILSYSKLPVSTVKLNRNPIDMELIDENSELHNLLAPVYHKSKYKYLMYIGKTTPDEYGNEIFNGEFISYPYGMGAGSVLKIDPDLINQTITITLGNPFNMDHKDPVYTSGDSLKSYVPSDSSFDYSYSGSAKVIGTVGDK